MLACEKVDIVDICTPSFTHTEFSIKAMKCGFNVISEKPAALKYDDIKSVYRCAKDNKVLFMATHVIRFWGEYESLKKAVEQKTYDELRHISFWRYGSGLLASGKTGCCVKKKADLFQRYELEFKITVK